MATPRHRRNRQSATNPLQLARQQQASNLPPPEMGPDPLLSENLTSDQTPYTGGIESLEAEPQPRKRRTDKAPRGRAKSSVVKPRERLATLYGQIGMLIYPVNQADGMIIIGSAESMANSLFDAAEHLKSQGHPEMYDMIIKLMQANVWLTLVSVHAAVGLSIMVNHAMLPPGVMRMFGKAQPEYAVPQPVPDMAGDATRYNPPDVAEQEAWMRAEWEAIAQQQAQGATVGYDPQDATPRENQDPASLLGLVRRG